MAEVSIQSLVASLTDLKRERHAASVRLADVQREVDALDEIISGIEKLAASGGQLKLSTDRGSAAESSQVNRVVSEEPLRGTAAIRKVMEDGRPWKQQAIIAEVKRRGWIKPDSKNPDSAIRENVRRMAVLGELEKLGHAVYRLAPPKQTIPPTFEEPDPGGA